MTRFRKSLLIAICAASVGAASVPMSVAEAQSLSTPTALTATAYSKTQIDVAWIDPSRTVVPAGDPSPGAGGSADSGYIVERLNGADAIATLQAGGLTAQQSHAVLDRLVDQQAFMLSANDVFYVSAALFLALIAVVWLARPVSGAPAAKDAAAGAH